MEMPFARLCSPMLIYASFLVRCWTKPDGTISIHAEHVQSGEHFKCDDLATLSGWMETVRQSSKAEPDAEEMEQE